MAWMAPGLPFAIAGQFAYPDRQSVAIVGDGGFAMLMAEMTTAVQHDLPIKIIVLKNNSLAEVKFEQVELGNPSFGCDLSPIDFVAFANACGADGYRCEKPRGDTASDRGGACVRRDRHWSRQSSTPTKSQQIRRNYGSRGPLREMADFGGGVCANRILLAYQQDLPALDDRSAVVVAAERAGLCRRGPSGSLHFSACARASRPW